MCDGVRKADKRVLPVHYRPASPARQPRGLKCSDPIRTTRFACFDAWRTIRAPSSDRTVWSAIGAIMTSHPYLTSALVSQCQPRRVYARLAGGLDFVAIMNREQRFGQRDWRMPNRRELRSLPSLQTRLPALPEQHPFIEVFNGWYWSSTTSLFEPDWVWPCTWKKAQRASDKNGSHSFRCEPWQRSIKGWRTRFDRADRVRRSRHLNASTNGRNRPEVVIE